MKHIPNLLSGLRILMIPFFVWQMLIENTTAAGIILVASGLTDLFDGQLARRYGWVTDLGKVLDPIADKLTQAAVSVTLAVLLREYWYFFAIMIVKDLVMLVLGGALVKKDVKIEGARWFGKLSTCVYYGVMILIILIPGLSRTLIYIMLAAATLCALIAAALYIPEYRRYRRMASDEKIRSNVQ